MAAQLILMRNDLDIETCFRLVRPYVTSISPQSWVRLSSVLSVAYYNWIHRKSGLSIQVETPKRVSKLRKIIFFSKIL